MLLDLQAYCSAEKVMYKTGTRHNTKYHFNSSFHYFERDSKALPNIPANNSDKFTIHTLTKSKSQQKLTMVTLPTNENADCRLPPETMMYQ